MLRKEFQNYKTWLLDCDGVILDSNEIKSLGFYYTTLEFGEEHANQLVEYHKKNGDVSRSEKMKFFQTTITRTDEDPAVTDKLVKAYGDYCCKGMMDADETPRLRDFLRSLWTQWKETPESCFIVSGTKQDELQLVFEHKCLDHLFNGIFGSPTTKYNIVNAISTLGMLKTPAVMVGDSKLDYDTARHAGIDFIFMSKFSEFEGWAEFFQNKPVRVIGDLSDLLSK
jgi:phosphoglycolate phosphatase-like HAD superfamily hydrolase